MRAEYQDSVLRVLFAGQLQVLPLEPASTKIEVANRLKRLGTDLANIDRDRIVIMGPAADEQTAAIILSRRCRPRRACVAERDVEIDHRTVGAPRSGR